MKKFFYLAIVSIFFTNCSSSPKVENNTNLTNSNLAVINQPNTNFEVQSDSNTVKAKNLSGSIGEMLGTDKNKGGNAKVPPMNAKPFVNPASDNSEITATMDKQGVPIETRTFKDNPMLVKVERVFIDLKNPQTRVYLKNGKVVNVSPDKLSNPSTASANEILTAAGIIPKSAPQKAEPKTEMDKKEQ